MKKTFILGAALAAACAFTTTTFTSCDNDDPAVVTPDG